jgi:hypothetical protein
LAFAVRAFCCEGNGIKLFLALMVSTWMIASSVSWWMLKRNAG